MKKAYQPPSMVMVTGCECEAGGLLGGVVVWVIGIGPSWIWS